MVDVTILSVWIGLGLLVISVVWLFVSHFQMRRLLKSLVKLAQSIDKAVIAFRNILGFIVALSVIAFIAYSVRPVRGAWMESFAELYFWILVAIIAISVGGAITRSGKAGAVLGFLAVWIPIFTLLILLFAVGEIHARFAVMVTTSFLLGVLGAFIGGSAGSLSALFLLWWGTTKTKKKSSF